MQGDLFQYNYVFRRASFGVYLKYKINKLELELLCMFSHYLRYRNRSIVSKVSFFESITGNQRQLKKLEGPLFGLLSKGFLGSFEYYASKDSLSLGLSDLGAKVLLSFQDDLKILLDKYPVSPYRLDGNIAPTTTQEPMSIYKAKTA